MKTKNICDLARTVRSKNAGSFMITLEIIFSDRSIYEKVKQSGVVTQEAIARAYDVPTEKVLDFMFFDPGMGIKANIRRSIASGGPSETDVYGCQQYAPLFSLEVPWDE
ncbi:MULTISPECIES: DUF4387 domain-containing protein [Aminobacterium]|jgi:hypothetical protein|uniref:DUF4387 domain-containing protein n=1 Tax=Aminobacterium colombiense (strain DSM 12261 / ALA-1) TaxID=572547 RepID=D5EGZ1_AMICL|nr:MULTISPECIES: DUF4387 domain-containing protein [Aminobacterium]MDD2379832.1 DUF4387 domain-containing protein [Aminobacterium colombiense]ADE57823.1 conserved hypothetical protein [Aminobacterium colombiense DSM 12261]MDD4265450.1 DUF4387 domain-containing protein [Aminobacterium colombiense]MDD4586519.1 DUF4387 domain-containing protein [Aminobacterium colombiense]NLK30045.1 DUF4387 domain-containing protein [Aminobacterium colombiense]